MDDVKTMATDILFAIVGIVKNIFLYGMVVLNVLLVKPLQAEEIAASRTDLPQTGKSDKVLVPDTLDLAHRAEFSINTVIGLTDPELDYEVHWRLHYVPPRVVDHSHQWFDTNPRGLEILTNLRLMNGSQQGLDVEQGLLASMLSRLGEDGLYYNAPFREDAPWRAGGYGGRKIWGTDDDISGVWGNAQFLVALIYRYQVTGDPKLLDAAHGLAEGLKRIAIYKDDYAYYPATIDFGFDFGYLRESGWPDTREALDETEAPEGTVACSIAVAVRALALYYRETGDEEALRTARLLTNYILKPRFWLGNMEGWGKDVKGVWSAHGGLPVKPAATFKGHFSGVAYTFQGLIEYALVADDPDVKEFVRQGYEYMRNFGLKSIGMYGENIANSIMAAVAIRMTDAGIGDYYEDVDQHVRNAMIEDQYIDAKILRKMCKEAGVPTEKGKYSIDKLLGSLRHEGIFRPQLFLDPTAMADMASPYMEPFYYVWESIIRPQGDAIQVNLLLNRASPWLDIDSYLPYEGKVVLRNKTAKNLFVRIPRWVDMKAVTCRIDNVPVSVTWNNRYLVLTGLTGGERVVIEFPMVERTETYYMLPYETNPRWYKEKEKLPRYILHFKGNTCVQADFPNKKEMGGNDFSHPCYQRKHYRKNKAPMIEKNRYIAPILAKW